MNSDVTDCLRPEIEVLLSDYYTGHLDAEQTRLVKEHLAECRPCRHSLRMMAAISAKIPPLDISGLERHYSPQLLGRYFAEPRSLDAELVRRIEQHVSICPECAADIQFLQDSDQDLRLSVTIKAHKIKKPTIMAWFRKIFGKMGG
jgi:anti-sigma factor RsiW